MAERLHDYGLVPESDYELLPGFNEEDLTAPPPYVETPTVTAKPELVTYANEEPELPKGRRLYHLAQGVPPFELSHPVKERLKRKFDEILEHNRYFDPKEDLLTANGYVRERFGLSAKPYIFWSSGGSDEILERLELLISDDPAEQKPPFYVVGPSFQNPYNFIRRRRIRDQASQNKGWQDNSRSRELQKNIEKKIDVDNGLITIESPLNSRMSLSLQKAAQIAQTTETPSIFSICNPSSPTGWVFGSNLIETLAEVCAEKGHLLHVDEAAEVGLADSESAIKFIEDYPNGIVTRSFAKIGLPLLRTGYAVMSPNIGSKYEGLRRPHDLDLKMGLLASLMQKDSGGQYDEVALIDTVITDVRDKTKEIKEALIFELFDQEVDHLPTSRESLLITIDGGDEGYFDRVVKKGIEIVPGESFRITHSQMSNRYIRSIIPPSVEDVPEVVKRFREAKKKK